MIKNLKVTKKAIAVLAVASTIMTMSSCSKKQEEQKNYQTIYMTEYDMSNHELYWDEKTQNELDAIADDMIAIKEVDDNTLYVASYYSLGYEAAMKNDSKQKAKENNPEYASNALFDAGYDVGKTDKYLKKAQEEERSYVCIRTEEKEEADYYPVEELTVISYNGKNALVKDYNEENINHGQYEDLLGQDMTNYIGQPFTAQSLEEYAKENVENLPDATYLITNNYNYIVELTYQTMEQRNTNNKTK